MKKTPRRSCPECGETVLAEPVGRRSFLRAAGLGAAALAMSRVPSLRAQDAKPDRTAEEYIKELYASLDADQKKAVFHPLDAPERTKLYNAAMGKKIGEVYTKPQQEVVGRILRSLSSGEEGWKQISRDGTWDASKAFENCGADLFGDVNGKFTWVFSGHHLTLRCDGNTEDGPAFGGPIYYGHSPNGYSERNLFNYQTKSALAVFDALTKEERFAAVIPESPGEGLPSVKFRCPCDAMPGIAYSSLSKEVRGLVEQVMRDILLPYRKSDVDEAMSVIKGQGGMERVAMAFYAEPDAKAKQPWAFWRVEGPGFVWNFRVLPHVHTFVNISSKV
jgi:hypothetical protein